MKFIDYDNIENYQEEEEKNKDLEENQEEKETNKDSKENSEEKNPEEDKKKKEEKEKDKKEEEKKEEKDNKGKDKKIEKNPEEFYREDEEIPPEQIEGIERVGEDKPTIDLNITEEEDDNSKKKESKLKKVTVILKSTKLAKWIKSLFTNIKIMTKNVIMIPNKTIDLGENKIKSEEVSHKQPSEKISNEQSTEKENYSLQELLDNSNDLSEGEKKVIEHHASIHGEQDAKKRFARELAGAKINLDVRKMKEERKKKKEEEMLGKHSKSEKTNFVHKVDNKDGHLEKKAVERVKGEVLSPEETQKEIIGARDMNE